MRGGEVYCRRPRLGFPITPATLNSLFATASSIPSPSLARQLHALFIKHIFLTHSVLYTSLLHMYGKCGLLPDARKVFAEMPSRDTPAWNSMLAALARQGELDEARRIFQAMPKRNVVSWTTMISGYSHNRNWEQAVAMYLAMEAGVEARPNAVTIASVLPACAKLGALQVGERVFQYATDHGLLRNLFVGNALIEMYAKCGRIDRARQVFDGLGMEINLCSWNSMIMGLAVHGMWEESLKFFHSLLERGIAPDGITITAALLACTHGGLVEEGQQIFYTMEKKFSVTPKLQHFGCMVDLLGRAGLIERAYIFIESMPMEPDSVVWGALLGACSYHGNVEYAEIAARFLFELEPWNIGNYVILSNIYAYAGSWDGVAKMWKLIKGSKIKKAAGYSCIEIGGDVHKFLSEDRSHPFAEQIYGILHDVGAIMRLVDHVSFMDFEFVPHWF